MNKIGGAVHRVQLLKMPADKLLHCKVHFRDIIRNAFFAGMGCRIPVRK